MPDGKPAFPGKEASAKAASAGGLVGASVANGFPAVHLGLVGGQGFAAKGSGGELAGSAGKGGGLRGERREGRLRQGLGL